MVRLSMLDVRLSAFIGERAEKTESSYIVVRFLYVESKHIYTYTQLHIATHYITNINTY